MRVEANCLLRWHEHDLNARVAAEMDGNVFDFTDTNPEVLQHDGPSNVDGEELMSDHVNLMNAMEALIQAYEREVRP